MDHLASNFTHACFQACSNLHISRQRINHYDVSLFLYSPMQAKYVEKIKNVKSTVKSWRKGEAPDSGEASYPAESEKIQIISMSLMYSSCKRRVRTMFETTC